MTGLCLRTNCNKRHIICRSYIKSVKTCSTILHRLFFCSLLGRFCCASLSIILKVFYWIEVREHTCPAHLFNQYFDLIFYYVNSELHVASLFKDGRYNFWNWQYVSSRQFLTLWNHWEIKTQAKTEKVVGCLGSVFY